MKEKGGMCLLNPNLTGRQPIGSVEDLQGEEGARSTIHRDKRESRVQRRQSIGRRRCDIGDSQEEEGARAVRDRLARRGIISLG